LKVEIEDGITGLFSDSFANCKNLSSISVPNTVEYIDDESFSGSASLTNVFYSGSTIEWDSLNNRSEDLKAVDVTCKYITVKFDPCGGNITPEKKDLEYDKPYGELPSPGTFDNNDFIG